MCALIFAPWLEFVGTIALFVLFGDTAAAAWLPVVALSILSGTLVAKGIWRSSVATSVLGITCVASVALGIAVGVYAQQAYLTEYWQLELGNSYNNVLPSEPGASHRDAAAITFADGTFLDNTRAVGYKTAGTTYCVAPILNAQDYQGRVEYWAVGYDCCRARGNFVCDDASDPLARSGIVRGRYASSPKVESIASSRNEHSSKLEVTVDRPGLVQAIRAAEAAHTLVSSEGALMLRWTVDTTRRQGNLQKAALMLILGAVGVHFLASNVCGCVVGRALRNRAHSRGSM